MSVPVHVDERLLNRARGGPEEGGWWRDAGRYIRRHGARSTLEARVSARNAMKPLIATARRSLNSPVSPLRTGGPDARIEPQAGTGFHGTSPRWT